MIETRDIEVRIPLNGVGLAGTLALPEGATGIVVFAHGSGSGRRSPRNRAVAQSLGEAGLATLLLDLLTVREEQIDAVTAQLRFDILLLADRLVGVADWLEQRDDTRELALGLFGASTGAAAALVAAARRPRAVRAVVSRGGRPDLAGASLEKVRAAVLLVVGGADSHVLALNREALLRLGSRDKRLEIVPGAGHLFEEPGALEQVADLARDWFVRRLTPLPAVAERR